MRRIALALGGLALAATLAACGSADAAPSGPPPSIDGHVTKVSTTGMKFNEDAVLVPGGAPFTIAFDNTAGSAPHNVAIKDATGKELFNGRIADAGKTATYTVPALTPGTYAFVCSLHPDMKGTITVD